MKKIFLLLLASFLSLALMAQDVYVSPEGSDDNAGTEASPFLTLQKALDAVSGSAAGKTVWLKGGTYQVAKTVTLDNNHSGAEGNPFVIRSMPGETVVLAGGQALSGALFEMVTSAQELARIPQAAHGKVVVAQLDENLAGLFPSKDQYNKTAAIAWNGYVLQNAQFPNKGYAYFSETLDAGPTTRWLAPGEQPAAYSEANPTGGVFKMRESIDWTMLQAEFDRNKDMLIDGYLNNDWYYQQERIGNIDASKETIQLLRYTSYGIGGHISLPRRFVIKNALCQLDQPGEWYYDREAMKFYIWPIQPPNSQTAITLLENARLIEGSKCSNITIRDIDFQNFGVEGVKLSEGENILIAGCNFRASNGMGCRLAKVMNSGIQSCDFAYLNQAFVIGGNTENRKTLTPENNYARNNYIHHNFKRGYGLMAVTGMGSEFKNNLVHNQNGALAFSGNDITMEYNEFYDVGYEMGDWNTIYNNGDASQLGNRVQHNFFHHMMETPGGYPVAPARTDDWGAGFHFDENIVYKGGRVAAMFYGPDCTMKGNVTLETGLLWWTIQQPYDKVDESKWSTQTEFLQDKYDEYQKLLDDIAAGTVSFNTKENKIGKAELIFGVKGWTSNTKWIEHYPNFSKMFDFFDVGNNPWMNTHNDITANYMSGGSSWPLHFHGGNNISNITKAKAFMPPTSEIDLPLTFSPSDMFEDADQFDFRFKSGFDAQEGFNKWDFSKVGLYIDEYRTSMPDKTAYRMAVKNKYDGIRSNGGAMDLDKINERYDFPEYLDLVSEFAVVSEGPAVYWPLDEGLGNFAADVVSGSDAKWKSADGGEMSWTVGAIGNAIDLSGSGSDYMEAESDTLEGATAMTMSAWVKLPEYPKTGGVVVNGISGADWGLYIDANKASAAFNGARITESTALSHSEWHHVLMTWENTGVAKLYVDGELAQTKTDASTSNTIGADWRIGKGAGGSSMLKSDIDDVAAFDIALSAEEVAFVYMNGLRNKAIRDISPIHVKSVSLCPSVFVLRVGYSAIISTEIFPANATFQNVVWESSDPDVLSVDGLGRIVGLKDGDVTLKATTVDGGYEATAAITVRTNMEGVVPTPDAYWPFNETDGNVAVDIIGGIKANWNGTEDQTWEDGAFSRAGTFHGGDQDRFVTESDPLLEATELTVSGWFNLDKLGMYEGLVTTRATGNGNNWGFSAADSKLDVRIAGESGYLPGMVSAGKWIYAAFTWNNNGERRTYVNGELIESRTSEATEYVSNNLWYFGDDVCCGGREIDGRIDEVMMYRKALTADQIKVIYELGKQGISYQDLTSIWPETMTFDKHAIDMKIGESDTIVPTILPADATNKTVLWESNNVNVASVDVNGVVLGTGLGEALIFGVTEEGGIKDSCTVKINPNPVESVAISKDSVDMMEDSYFTLSALVLPETATDRSVVWSTSDENVVTMYDQNGVIEGENEGTAWVYVKTNFGDFSDSCFVNVKAIHVETVTLDKHELDIASGNFIYFDATVLPADAKNKTLIWSTSDDAVVSSMGDDIFYATAKGTAVVKAVAEDGGIADSCVIYVDGGTAINDILSNDDIAMYPNPVNSILNLKVKDYQHVTSVEICNALGQVVKQVSVLSAHEKVNVSSLEPGLYIVKLSIDNTQYSAPFVIE